MKLWFLVSFVLFTETSFAQYNPLKDPNICGRPTCKGDGKFKYKKGIEYQYLYKVDINTLFNGTSKNESTLHIEGVAYIDIVSECDGLLTLTDLKLSEKPNTYDPVQDIDIESPQHANSEVFSEMISQYTLRFSFHDGVISEVCSNEDEKNWVLNFKKGLLSLLHNTVKRFDLDHNGIEEDIRGKCNTVYKVLDPNGTSLVIEKTKDLTSCESRSKLHSMVQSTPYNFRPNTPGTNLLNSTSICKFSIDHHIYKDILCVESHVFQPFSNQDAGATTIVKQSLTLIDEQSKKLDEQLSIERRSALTYDQVPTPKPTSVELRTSRELIKKLCKLSTDDVQIEFSDLFTKFIHTSRLLSFPALSVLYERVGTICTTGKKHILDALPYLGSSASVALMKNIILKGTLPETTINEWMLSMALIPWPDIQMIETSLDLLQHKYHIPSVPLGVASLTYTFCMQNKDCSLQEAVEGIIQHLEEKVTTAYSTKKHDRKEQETMIISLKALSNIGEVTDSFKQALSTIIEDPELDVAIRVSAIETHRRFPCEDFRPYFENLFRNIEENSEIRIAAYLQVMRCPNYVVVKTIRHSLEVEEVNQVGSFIWSHLHNLLKSSIPSRVEIQALLSDKDLLKKFSSDVRKFSHNYEGSVFFEEYNVGANYESNVIFSPSSYIPRSAMLNVTVDLFGESINMLEVYGRMEGFEHYIESIFGPKGEFSDKKFEDKISKFRLPRSVRDNEVLKTKIEKFSKVIDNNFDYPKVAMGLKIFGNDLKYVTFNGDHEIKAALSTLNPVDHLKRILSGKEINYNKAAMFLDSSYVVPSGAGLPLTLNAVGTAAINMKILGSLNATNLKDMNFDVNANIQPNVAVDIVGTMSVDAYYASTGIKVKTSLYTSSAVEGNVAIRSTKLVRVTFGLPKQTTEILGAKSELIVMKGSLEEQQMGINENGISQHMCTWPAVENTIGLKLCADYHFNNVTDMRNAPYFILAGPSGFRLSLQKMDPTARTYFMEYKWKQHDNRSDISLIFDTPGASVPRLLSANLTHNNETGNLTLSLESTAGKVLARGKYKNTVKEKYLQLELDINNQKNFDALLSLEQEDIKYGHTYIPKLYLGVNAERVVELQGTLKWVEKFSVSQCDVNLKFKTKRLNSKLFGYISRTNASIGANLRLDYKFNNTKEQIVKLDFTVADRSAHTIATYVGDAQIRTTAYPNMNFNSSFKFQRAAGHTDCKFELKSSPTLFDGSDKDSGNVTTFQLQFSHRTLVNSTRFKASASLTKPSTDLDLKGQIAFDIVGHTMNGALFGRYAKGKEFIISAYWFHPRQTLENIEGRLNITVPSYSSMVLEGRLKEHNFHNYIVDLNALWFTGHNISMRGMFQEKSTVKASNRHLKMVLRSPSFNEINADIQFYRDNNELKIDVKADHNNDAYEFFLKHASTSTFEMTTVGKLKYKTKVYSFTSSVSLKDQKQIKLELHIDQLRDIHLAMWGHNEDAQKALGFEVKWDANRDPNQKLVVTVDVSNPTPYNYEGNFVVSYPGRTINGLYIFLWKDEHFSTIARLAWNTQDSFALKFSIDYRDADELYIIVKSELLTPFEDLRKTSLNAGFHHIGNMYRANASVFWQNDQRISIDLFGDYTATAATLECEFRGSLVSTVHDIPSLSASVKHSHNGTKVDTNLHVMYHPKQIIDLKSVWQIDKDRHMTNLTGTVIILSPFRGFNKGLLVSKIYVANNRHLRGIADLDVDHKKFTASVEGHLQKLTGSMLAFNMTTPFEKYNKLSGRFEFSDEKRHLVAKITHPTGSIGLEVIFFIQSFSNFDVKFNLATPIEFLQEILIVGKLKADRADFRLGWNNILAGFTGVWYYANVKDFEYSYKIYTPIDEFKENGIVAKLIFKEGLDFEVSINLAQSRLGITFEGKPKPMILKELGIETQSIYKGKLSNDDGSLNANLEQEDPFSWEGFIKIEGIIYTIEGTVDIDQKGTVYDLLATLTIPAGKLELRNEFDYIHLYAMKNRLYLSTPYKSIKTITSNYALEIIPSHQYFLALDFNYQNETRWIETGAQALYISPARQDDNVYNLTLHVHTPSSNFSRLDLASTVQLDENFYRANFTMNTEKSDVRFSGSLMATETILEAQIIDFYVKAPDFPDLPPVRANFLRDFSQPENKIKFHIDSPENKTNKIDFMTMWRYESWKNFKTALSLETPFETMDKYEAAVDVLIGANESVVTSNFLISRAQLELYGNVRDDDIYGKVTIDLNTKKHVVVLNGSLVEISKDKREINGVLTINDKAHDVSGFVEMPEDKSCNMLLNMKPNDGSIPFSMGLQVQPQPKGYAITSSLKREKEFARLEIHTAIKHKLDWDLYLQADSSNKAYSKLGLHAKATTSGTNTSLTFNAKTPFQGMESPQLGVSVASLDSFYYGNAFYKLKESNGNIECIWSWLLLENMSIKLIGNYQTTNYARQTAFNAFYVNPNKTFELLKVGGDVDLNKTWAVGSNLTLSLPGRNKIDVEANMKLSPRNNGIHTMRGKFYAYHNFSTIEYLAKYNGLVADSNYGSAGNISFTDKAHMNGDVDIEWGQKLVNNYLDLETSNNITHLLYKLHTPEFEQGTVVARLTYKESRQHHNVTCEIFHPSNRTVGKADIDFEEFGNMNGTVNVTTPFRGLSYIGANFITLTNPSAINRYVQLFWVNNTAVIDSKCKITTGRSALERDTNGVVLVEIPLTTRHVARVDYGYTEKPQLSTGRATVEYNRTKILEGKYNCLSESQAGFDKDTIHVELENKLFPVGADYVHGYKYNAPGDGSNTPTVDSKRLHVYNSHNKTALNVTGEMIVETTLSGQQIALTAIHSNRTVKFWTTYDVLDQQFKQHSRLELDSKAWVAYDIDLLNKTTDDTSEAQQIQINLSYPQRNFTALGSYNITDSSLSSEVSLEWDKERKVVQAEFDWKRDELHPNHQEVCLQIKHPSFEKNVTIHGMYEATERKLADIQLTVNYSTNPEQLVRLNGIVENHSEHHTINYTYGIWGRHPATQLTLDMRGGIFWRPKFLNSTHLTDYSRTFLTQSMEATAQIDLEKNEINLKRKTPTELSYLWGRYAGKFPLYTANVSAIYGNDINASGEFYLNFKEKLVQLELNKTTDGSQSLHMYGVIPDARSSVFDIWRDYEDIRVSDVSYFLRLNHSRLVVSSLKWRPDLKQEIKSGIRSFLYECYTDFTEDANNARQYIRSEMTDSISGIWKDAKPHIQKFLDDVKDLGVIEEDLQELKGFLNNSYNANEFYIRDLVGFVLYTIDEMSLRSHIESLPAIVNEIWEIMGESGKKIHQSILWAIEKIKLYYKNATEFITGFLQGDSLEHLSDAFKDVLEKYDNFIKDMHVSFIRYMEDLWHKTYIMLVNNWHKTLATIEPTFIKIIHYSESIVWNAGQEFVDFLYIRRSELMRSTYFQKFANFAHDLDRFYKDINGNDTVGAIYKYSKVGWNFIKQKYFEVVPFAKELQQVVSEIVDEITALKNLPSIRFVMEKYDEIYEKVKWFCDYFDVQNRAHRFITLIRLKLTNMKQNALQAENRYREAKTKFIFEPADGIMYLEQKLPMSWHAFNETPKFEEIPEYKAIRDMQKYFTTSKMTFTSLYQDYKPLMDPSDWLPPFKAQAMLARGKHYITFDRKVYSFKGHCTYLLASDFIGGNFSIAVSYDKYNPRAYELLILIEKSLIQINLQTKVIRIGNNPNTALPTQIGHAYLYQDADIVTLESQCGFVIRCNMKFDVCMLEVSGWYFGKTAGLWGTMNNEALDDLLTPEKIKAPDSEVQNFAESWSLDRNCHTTTNRLMNTEQIPENVDSLCKSFFSSNVSPFFTCFPRVPTKSILDMCLASLTEEEACTSAIVYMEMCAFENIPLRIPDACVNCNLRNGSVVPEGAFIPFEGKSVPQSADIVFLVEAQKCNADVRKTKKIDMIVEHLDRELSRLNIRQNRYSVVTFGNGNGVFDQPRSVVINSSVFTEHQLIPSFFDHIQTGEGNNPDIFGALTFGSKLLFRPGVSKTFILLPCTDCSKTRMELDYSILHQLLLENDITLHILMNEEFQHKKTRGNKIFFGIDRYMAYTKKDADVFKGDGKLRKELQLPKSKLGFCMPLALESNGSIFTAKKLELKIARKVATVFAKRMAHSAVPSQCKTCECTAHNTGVSYMECFPCSYPTPVTADFEFNEDDVLAGMQPGDEFYEDYDY